MEEKNKLLEDWQKTSETRTQTQFVCVEFAYGADEPQQQKKRQISEALAFWRLVTNSDLVGREKTWLEAFLQHENKLIGLVAIIELMPLVLWRRILWRYNIDFQSRESFLRRLKPEQLKAIEANHTDLAAGRVPRAFSRWEVFTRGITVEKLKNYQIEHQVNRFQSKSAWSFNLKPFDFGFNAYPNGERDDKAEFFVSTKKFLSAKKHENDFVVDKEFGGYWWLYRKARSNFAYRPYRKVELKPQVCPGFWWTIIIHLWFWIVSPALLVSHLLFAPAVKHVWNLPWLWLVALPFALLTPLWLLSASIRLLFKGVLWFLVDWLSETATDYLKIGMMVLGLMTLALAVISTAANIYLVLVPHLGKLCSLSFILIIISTFALCVYRLSCKENHLKFRREALQAWYAQLVLTAFAFLVIHGQAIFRGVYLFFTWLIHLIISAASFLIASFAVIGLYWLLLILPVGVVAISWYFLRLPIEKQEKAFILLDRFSPLLFAVYIAIPVVIAFYKVGVIVGLIFLVVAIIGWLGAIWMMRERNPVRHRTQAINRNINSFNSFLMLPYGLYIKNDKLQGMPEAEQRELLEKAARLICNIFGYGKGCSNYFYSLVAKLDQATLERFEKFRHKLGSLESLVVKDKVFWLMLDQPELSYHAALQIAEHKQSEKKQSRQQAVASLKWLATPFIFAGKAIYRAASAFVELCQKLVFLYNEFNKRCPFIEQPKNLWY